MKLYIITGEPSGDLHAANLVDSLIESNPNIHIRAWGGNRLITKGVELAMHIRDTAFMGLLDVIKNLGSIRNNLDYCKSDILNFNPDAIVLVDYPGFNLKIAKFANLQGIKVFYYITPKVWAWNKKRIYKLKKYVDEIIVIFPFEVEFYKKHGISVTYVGNPLIDEISKGEFKFSYNTDKPIIALLPGSRKQEIECILPEMLKIVKHFPKYQFIIAATSTFTKDYYHSFIDCSVEICFDETYGLLSNSEAALVTSGTATLETALFNVPQVVCYKTNWITYFLAKTLIKVKFLSLVNIIMNNLVVRELIQSDLNKSNLYIALESILSKSGREDIISYYHDLKICLGNSGASKKAADLILFSTKNNKRNTI